MDRKDLYFGGLPTEPDVKKLKDAYPDIPSLRGSTIPHKDIERLLGVRHRTHRYRTIIDAWRRWVYRETGIAIRGDLFEVKGIGLRVLTPVEQDDYHLDLRRGGGRKIKRSWNVLADIDPDELPPERRIERERNLLAVRFIYTAFVESKKMPPPTPGIPIPMPKRPMLEKPPDQE